MEIRQPTPAKPPILLPVALGQHDPQGRPLVTPAEVIVAKATAQQRLFVPPSVPGGGLIPSLLGPGATVAKVDTAADLLAKLRDVGVPGGVASTAWSGFQISNTMTHDEIVQALIKNGVTDTYANQIAGDVLNAFKSTPAKILLVAVAAGGATWAVANFLGWSKRKTLIAVILTTLTAVAVFLILCRAGILSC